MPRGWERGGWEGEGVRTRPCARSHSCKKTQGAKLACHAPLPARRNTLFPENPRNPRQSARTTDAPSQEKTVATMNMIPSIQGVNLSPRIKKLDQAALGMRSML